MRRTAHSVLGLMAGLVLLSGLASAAAAGEVVGQVFYSGAEPAKVEWSEEERAKDIAVRPLQRTEHVSTHLIRLRGSEFPHYHDRHDLIVMVRSGTSVLHFADRDLKLGSGDVAFVPKGALHWAENTDPEASVVLAVFAPPFDGKDRRRAE